MQNKSKYPLSSSLSILENSSKKNVRILEAGCGTGRLLRFFHENKYDIIGIDFTENAIKKILELELDLKAELGDISNLRFESGIFSHVLAFGLYHNFEEEMLIKSLKETNRVLEKGGILCASFRADNLQNWIIDKFFNYSIGSKKRDKIHNTSAKKFHKMNLTKAEITSFVKCAGFKITRIYKIDNMPLLYKLKIFRNSRHKNFDENLARKDGYSLNMIGSVIQLILRSIFSNHFFSLYVVNAKKI